jgi:hypothetical protein
MAMIIGADGGTRTRTPLLITDFKSVASTISPRPHTIQDAETIFRRPGQVDWNKIKRLLLFIKPFTHFFAGFEIRHPL